MSRLPASTSRIDIESRITTSIMVAQWANRTFTRPCIDPVSCFTCRFRGDIMDLLSILYMFRNGLGYAAAGSMIPAIEYKGLKTAGNSSNPSSIRFSDLTCRIRQYTERVLEERSYQL